MSQRSWGQMSDAERNAWLQGRFSYPPEFFEVYGMKAVRCWLCEELIFAKEQQSKDHIVPRYFGGTNEVTNLAWAHQTCNNLRGLKIVACDRRTRKIIFVEMPMLSIYLAARTRVLNAMNTIRQNKKNRIFLSDYPEKLKHYEEVVAWVERKTR